MQYVMHANDWIPAIQVNLMKIWEEYLNIPVLSIIRVKYSSTG